VDYIFCYPHFQDLQDGLIDECLGCGKAKSNDYELCIPCNRRASPYRGRSYGAAAKKRQWYKPEYSEAWEKADAQTGRFYAYILKLEDGQFYAGQTRELRERLSEHRDGRVKSTTGRSPKLVWFTSLDSRESAASLEVELKKLVDSNPREIRRMILGYQDLIRELDYS
jgi:predicted GIY-YIG superfamily endonuclease